jgi:2-aminoethylphosphonate dioxygenase
MCCCYGRTWERGIITRAENFVHLHAGWKEVTDPSGAMGRVCSALFREEAVLFKEKLNYKPAGGAGFLPHLDHPSLAFYAPPSFNSFITVMVAIDDMTKENGCLRVCKGTWHQGNAVACIAPEGDPEVGGRAGGIVPDVVPTLEWTDIECRAGDCFFFNGFIPHRSGSNTTSEPRRAVFFTYNPRRHGDFRSQYYKNLADIRQRWKDKLVSQMEHDYTSDLAAMSTVPTGGFSMSRYTVKASSSAYADNESESSTHDGDAPEVEALF